MTSKAAAIGFIVLFSFIRFSAAYLSPRFNQNHWFSRGEALLLAADGEPPDTGLSAVQEAYLNSILGEALHKCNALMRDDEQISSPKLLKLFDQCQKSVQVQQSSIPNAGNGLFASQYIPPNTIVSFYPVHAVGVNINGASIMHADEDDAQWMMSDNHNGCNYLLYLLGDRSFPGNIPLVQTFGAHPFIDTHPYQTPIPGWFAHFVNDAAIIHENTEKGLMEYMQKSYKLQNCVLIPFGPAPLCVAITTREVRETEELFCSYGCGYWQDAMNFDNSNNNDNGDESTKIKVSDQVQSLQRDAFEDMVQLIDFADDAYSEEAVLLQKVFDSIE